MEKEKTGQDFIFNLDSKVSHGFRIYYKKNDFDSTKFDNIKITKEKLLSTILTEFKNRKNYSKDKSEYERLSDSDRRQENRELKMALRWLYVYVLSSNRNKREFSLIGDLVNLVYNINECAAERLCPTKHDPDSPRDLYHLMKMADTIEFILCKANPEMEDLIDMTIDTSSTC